MLTGAGCNTTRKRSGRKVIERKAERLARSLASLRNHMVIEVLV
jgi:hypothetical protein